MAQALNQPVDAIKNYYQQNQDNLDFFKHTLLEKQAIRLIINSSNVEEFEPELKEKPEADES
jgi:trigger factor